MYTHKYFQNVFDDYFCDDTKRKELKSKITDIQEEYTSDVIKAKILAQWAKEGKTHKDIPTDELDYLFYTGIFDDTDTLDAYENGGIGIPDGSRFRPLKEADKNPAATSNAVNRFKWKFRGDKVYKTKKHWEYIFVIYFWFHVFAIEKHGKEYSCETSLACKLDQLFVQLFPNKAYELLDVIIKIRDQYNRSSKPTKELFEKWVEIAKIKSEQDKSDINNIQKLGDNISDKDSEREVSELTPEQRQKIVDQIISIGKNGLVSTSFSVSEKEGGYYPVIGEIHGTKEDILLECDGLDYDSEILFTEFSLIFKMKGLSLENPNHTTPSDIGVEYHWQTDKNEWKITFYEVSEKSALRGNLLRFTNGAVFYASVDENHKTPNIDIIRKCSKNHLNVRFIGFRYEHMPRDENKEMLIRELIQKETLKVFSEEEAHIKIEENKSHA